VTAFRGKAPTPAKICAYNNILEEKIDSKRLDINYLPNRREIYLKIVGNKT
jgi:hypothetical protein